MKILLGAAALAAFLPISCAVQQAKASAPHAVFVSVDASGDDQISAEEFCEAYFTLVYSYLDLDGDARVTRLEWTTIETGDEESVIFARLDADGNGSLTYVEFSSPQERREIIANMFGTLDRNGDGVLVREEIIVVEDDQ